MKVFIPAAPRPAWQNLARTGMQALVFWTVFIGVLPLLLAHAGDVLGLGRLVVPLQDVVAGTIMVLALLLNVGSAVVMAVWGQGTPFPADTARELVVRGPYRFVRNPMALGGLGFGFGLGLAMGAPLVLLYAVAGGVVWNVVARPLEERDLEQRFGASYVHYRDAVRCWVPHLGGYRPPG